MIEFDLKELVIRPTNVSKRPVAHQEHKSPVYEIPSSLSEQLGRVKYALRTHEEGVKFTFEQSGDKYVLHSITGGLVDGLPSTATAILEGALNRAEGKKPDPEEPFRAAMQEALEEEVALTDPDAPKKPAPAARVFDAAEFEKMSKIFPRVPRQMVE